MLKTRSQTVQGLFVLHLAKDSIKDSITFNVKQVFECFWGCRLNTKGRVKKKEKENHDHNEKCPLKSPVPCFKHNVNNCF